MGCDIHWYSETRRDGKWTCDQAASREIEDEDEDGERYVMDNFPDRDRDYWLFGTLQSGLRSGFPWAFPYTDALPADVSSEVKEQSDNWGSDGHSHGARTRAELKAKHEEIRLARAELLIAPQEYVRDEHAAHVLSKLTEIIGNLNANVPDEDQRIVFWFDN